MRKLRARKRELWAVACILLYLAVNVWILYKLFHIREYADIAALSCQAGSIAETAFAQWRENGDGGMYSWAAVWKAEKKRRIISEDTGGGLLLHDQGAARRNIRKRTDGGKIFHRRRRRGVSVRSKHGASDIWVG